MLAVLWLSAALSAITLTLAITVRGELDRAGSSVDAARAYYMAEGAVERFLLLLANPYDPQDRSAPFRPGQRRMRWELESGFVDIEITGEGGKLNLWATPPETLARLFGLLGVSPDRALQIASQIVARRSPSAENSPTGPSFSSRLPSFIQLEDLLTVGGVTPDIYYGWFDREGERRLVERGGIARYLTLQGGGAINVNYASPEVLRAVGVPEGPLGAILQEREGRVIDDPTPFGSGALAANLALTGGGSVAYTVRATAQLKDRPVRRTVRALVRYANDPSEPPVGVVRWYASGN